MEIERAQPAVIVYVNHHTSWLKNPASEIFLLQWFRGYAQAKYVVTGIIDMISPHVVHRKWGEEVRGYDIQSKTYILVFRRKQ